MSHIFISHSTKDDEVVAGIREALEALGLQVWADSRELAAGAKLAEEVEKAIETARQFIVVLSVAALNSAWVTREIEHALKVGKKVIPVLVPPIGPGALHAWFKEEPVAIQIPEGPGGVSAVLPDLLAALGERLPADHPLSKAAEAAPIADLVLELTDPAIEVSEGTRRANAVATLRYRPADGGEEVKSRRFPFTAPLGPIEEDDLRWYLERYIHWPSKHSQERAGEIERKLPRWGVLIYQALTGEVAREAFEAWRAARKGVERRFTVLVDRDLVAGADEKKQAEANEAAALLLALPWELVHDGEGYLFLGADAVRVRRSLPNRKPQGPLVTGAPLRVLLVSPRPEDEKAGYLDHRASAKPAVEALAALGELAEFKILSPATFPRLQSELERAREANEPYHVVHFDGHGVFSRKHGLGALCFEDPEDEKKTEDRRTKLVMADEIAEVIRGHRVPLFFLDACQTVKTELDPTASVAGKLLQSGVASVAAMSHSVLVETARRFVTAFYHELVGGQRVGHAMHAGQRALKASTWRGKTFTGELHLQDWFVPVLFQEERDPQLVRQVPPEQVRAVVDKQRILSVEELPPEPAHTFVGRSRELLMAERLLEQHRSVVLRGEGGEGKTTLAAELARWLVASRRFQRAAFVSFEKYGDARNVLYSLGRQLVPDFLSQAAADGKRAWQLVERALAEQPTLLVLDSMESVLPPPEGSPAEAAFEPEILDEIGKLCRDLQKFGRTHLVFTSREPMPDSLGAREVRIGRLERSEAIKLVGRVLGDGKLMHHAADAGESDEEIEKLVDAVNCHARSLVLLAGEVAASGVRNATEKLGELMAALHKRHPDDRERSLFASVELSLRRLPVATRQRIRPLGVFQGGGSLVAIGLVLGLDAQPCVDLARRLEDVGLAERVPPDYLRLDPALGPALLSNMSEEEREAARKAWAEAMAAEASALEQMSFKGPAVAQNLALLALPNLVAAVEHLSRTAGSERVVGVATDIESLISPLGHPKASARVAKVREAAAGQLGSWSHARHLAEAAAVDRLLEQGLYSQAVAAAKRLLETASAAGEGAYDGAAYDLAVAHFRLGRALRMSGAAAEAIAHVDYARTRSQALGQARMANTALTEKADCLTDLGRLDEAAAAYQEVIRQAEARNDPRQVAVNKGQLATVRLLQRKYADAIAGYEEARRIFENLGEPKTVATAWHQIGMVHEKAGQYDAAEEAYQKSLTIEMQIGNRGGEASTLGQLGNLYGRMGRTEEAVRFYRQTADIYSGLRDPASEGRTRNNVAIHLIKLRRHEEARRELLRAIECKKPFGHAAQPWTTFAILSNLERAVGDQAAAAEARQKAIDAYLAYRRDGGEPPFLGGRLCLMVAQAIAGGQTARVDLPSEPKPLIAALRQILAGSRDPALADDSNLDYDDAAELRLLLERLAGS